MNTRTAKAFRTKKEAGRYWILLTVFLLLGVLAAYGLLTYDNPVPVTSSSFLPVVKRRINAVTAMLIAAVCQSLSTVAFQSVTGNRIITPSLLGFEALYTAIHTAVIFFLGTRAFMNTEGVGFFILQIILMVGMCLILYGWLLAGKKGNLQLMLLVGVIMGTGLRSLSSFMQRLLTPSDFDILQAKLFGSVNNADPSYYPVAVILVAAAGLLLMLNANTLNVVSLGKAVSQNVGVNHKAHTIYTLVLIAVLMSVSTALIGSLTFYGFLVAALSYQLAPTYDHKYLFPMALALGFLIITAAYFIMYHVFNAQGVVSIIIEMVGGIVFLVMIMRKGAL